VDWVFLKAQFLNWYSWNYWHNFLLMLYMLTLHNFARLSKIKYDSACSSKKQSSNCSYVIRMNKIKITLISDREIYENTLKNLWIVVWDRYTTN
jgi:hypothetical protein